MYKKIFNYGLGLILLFGLALRVLHLSYPQGYIFDEVYHAFTAKEYLHGNIAAWEWWTTPPPGLAYEWTHPPIAKYGMELGMVIFGENAFGYRFPSALMGVATIIGSYYFMLTLFKKKSVALLSAFFVAIEGINIAQSRIAMNDTYMLAFFIWSIISALNKKWKLSAFLYGLSLASKWSSLYGVIPLAFIYLHEYKFRPTLPYLITHIFAVSRLLLIAILVYILSFTPFILAGHSWGQWWELQRQMWYYHTHLVATHAYQSTPLEWIFAARPVWYFVDYGESVISNIYVQANPLLLWLGLAAIIIQIPRIFSYSYSLLYLLYLIFVVPWIFSPRIMFFYHYLPSAYFLMSILSLWVTSLPRKYQIILIIFSLLSLIFVSPMLFGIAMQKSYWDYLFKIFPSWR